ncbi:AAA family ATPase [Streptomyces sp. NPDC005386]|uniref:nSTAND1 domain-containing NTPase n=1 Tax=Streptomyces sp. NPDC005386 TaxID=3154562 RepID=UPI0033AFF06D
MSELPPQISPPPDGFQDPYAFGHALRRLRVHARFSLRQASRACAAVHPIAHSTIENWEKGGIVRESNEPAFVHVLQTFGVADQADVDAWLHSARSLRARPRPSPFIAEPYRGLESYDTAYAQVFFGRNAIIERLLDELRDLQADGGALLLTGASGSGKSSILRAGLVPALSEDRLRGSAGWPVLSVISESSEPDPLNGLVASAAAYLNADTGETADRLRGGAKAVQSLLRQITDVHHGADPGGQEQPETEGRVVIIIDQFERALVSAEDGPGSEETLEAFFAVLRLMASAPTAALVILGVRLDFLDAAILRDAPRTLTGGRPPVVVEPMSEEDLASIVGRPARAFNVHPEAGFVETVLGEISARGGRFAHQAGVLPLLSHALQMTWQRGSGREMTVANYRAVGGVEGALRETAESIYASLSADQQADARRMFLSLVHVSPSGTATRRQVTQSELLDDIGQSRAEAEEVLDRFVAGRLLTVDEVDVEITHEALMAAWPQLRRWLEADRGSRLVAQQIAADARTWDKAKRPRSDLYSATRLQQARDWRTNHPSDVSGLAGEFIDASVRQWHRKARQLKTTAVVLAVLVLLASGLAGLVSYQAHDLREQRDEAQSRMLATQSSIVRLKDVNVARQLALVAYRISPTPEARSALIEATALPPAVRMVGAKDARIMYAVGIHPGGSVAAAAVEDTVRLWDLTATGHPRALPYPAGTVCRKIYALTFSPDGSLLAASCADGSIHLWDTQDPAVPRPLPSLTSLGVKVYSVAFSSDSRLMAAAIADRPAKGRTPGSVRLWALKGSSVKPLDTVLRVSRTSPAKSVSFHPGGEQLAVGGDDGTVQLWNISNPAHPSGPIAVPGTTKAIGQLAFSPNGKFLAAGGADNLVHLWSTDDGRRLRPQGKAIAGAASYINAIAFSPDATTLAIASSDSSKGLRLVDIASRRTLATLPHPAPVTSVKFSPDGKRVFTGANDGIARLWPVTSPQLEGMTYTVSAARFSPDGKTLALGSSDLQLLDVGNPQGPRRLGPSLTNPDGFSGTVAFAPNGRLLAQGHGRSGRVQLWRRDGSAPLTRLGPPFKAHPLQVETLAFSPDSTVLATGARDGAVHLWDVRKPGHPQRMATAGTFGGMVTDVGFSRNGRLLVAASADKTVRLWDVSDPRTPRSLGEPLTPARHYVYAAVFNPDSTRLAVGLADSTVRLYDISDPSHLKAVGKPLSGPHGYVFSLAFPSDGTALAATAGDGSVWLWNLHGEDPPTVYATLRMSTGAMYPINYQPRTRILVAGGDERKAWIWTTDVDDAIALICRTTGDPLTSEEWATYLPADRGYSRPCP